MKRETTEAVFAFIQQYIMDEGMAPSQREIAKACYLAPSAVLRHLDRLEAWGWIIRQPNKARSIRIPRIPDPD
jgi:SOS-response transcriptional repressor LexA